MKYRLKRDNTDAAAPTPVQFPYPLVSLTALTHQPFFGIITCGSDFSIVRLSCGSLASCLTLDLDRARTLLLSPETPTGPPQSIRPYVTTSTPRSDLGIRYEATSRAMEGSNTTPYEPRDSRVTESSSSEPTLPTLRPRASWMIDDGDERTEAQADADWHRANAWMRAQPSTYVLSLVSLFRTHADYAHPVPVLFHQSSSPTRNRPSSDTGTDIIGWRFKEKSLGNCIVIAPDTFLDDNNILWHTLQVSCSKHSEDPNLFKVREVRTYIRREKSSHGPPAKPNLPVPPLLRPALPPELRQPIEEHAPFRAILIPPKSVPPKCIRLPAKSTRDERRRRREQHRVFSARVRFAGPDSDAPILHLPILSTWTPMANP
jgi:hypothetical protein